MRLSRSAIGRALALALGIACVLPAWAASEQQREQSLEQLRQTVINLLQALVDQGVISKEKAQQLVQQAEDKAKATMAAEAAQKAQQEKEEQNAVRVPYVPQIVKKEIESEVAKEVRPAVTSDVLQQAKTEGWGVPGALPDWILRVKVFGDLTMRGQADLYGPNNSSGCPPTALYGNCTVLDYQTINQDGGIGYAGTAAYLNINQDRWRTRLRARLGAQAQLDDNWQAAIRIDSGTLDDPSSESQTLGNEFGRYPIGLGQAYLQYDARTKSKFDFLTAYGGRFQDPFFAPTELVYAKALSFDGLAGTGRLPFGGGGAEQSNVFLTIGGFPVQEVPLVAKNDKWLAAGQLGVHLDFNGADQFIFAVAYYDFIRVQGVPNPKDIPNSTINNYTAPLFVRYGNSMFDISNSTNPAVNLFALAAPFRVADIAANYNHPVGRYTFAVDAEAARNTAFNQAEILARTGLDISPRVNGYVGDISFGDPLVENAMQWRATAGYRYVQRDAVLDALTDADFHEGGTNAEGYFIVGDLGLGRHIWMRLRYLPSRGIDGPIYQVDIWQLDFNAFF